MYKKLTLLLLLTLITFTPQSTFAEEAITHIDTNLKNTMIDIMQPITINLTVITKKAQDILNQNIQEVQNEKTLNQPKFGSDGLLVMQQSDAAQNVVNLLLDGIPSHSHGADLHITLGIDTAIDQLSTEEALWVLWRCEGPGFGQTGAGWDGIDSPESHQNFVKQQLDERFGTIHNLLKAWGTFDYDGY